jgi:hypothetical protein
MEDMNLIKKVNRKSIIIINNPKADNQIKNLKEYIFPIHP